MSDRLSRREFLYSSGLGLGALIAAGCGTRPEGAGADSAAGGAAGAGAAAPAGSATAAANTAGGGGRTAHIGVQLYTVRTLMEKDMAGTLKSIAAIGYPEVEFAGYYKKSAQDVRAMLDANGLRAPSAHIPLDAMRADMKKVIADSKVIGHEIVICPYLEAPKTAAAWSALAKEFNGFGTTLKGEGLQFAYHNHDFEFKPVEGKMPYDVLLAETDPQLVKMEMDLFWATKAGQDPVAYFGRYPGRFPAVHVKDMRDLRGAQTMTEVGSGEIDFRRIFAQADQGGIQHYIVEHDQPADALASVRTSYGNLRRVLA
jgi:sugar phosphate isomerase/epimerase